MLRRAWLDTKKKYIQANYVEKVNYVTYWQKLKQEKAEQWKVGRSPPTTMKYKSDRGGEQGENKEDLQQILLSIPMWTPTQLVIVWCL